MGNKINWLGILAGLGLLAAVPAGAQDFNDPDYGTGTQPPVEESEETAPPSEQLEPAPAPEQQPEGSTQQQVIVVPLVEQQQKQVKSEKQSRGPKDFKDTIVLEAGAGGSTYTEDLGDVTRGGTEWSGRAILGARWPVGLELGYTGTFNAIEGTGVDSEGAVRDDRSIISNAGEALARISLVPNKAMVRPFIAGGVNYLRLDTDNRSATFADTIDNQDTIGFPLAAGVQVFPWKNLSIGARGDYKILTDILTEDFPAGNQWGGALTIGGHF